MANPEHLEMLRQGREMWHEWRRQKPRVSVDPRAAVDLSHADLREMNLKGRDLSWANFNGSDLRRADMSGAVFDMATFRGADLSEADFGSKEVRTDHLVQLFAGASLFSVDMRDANLSKARLVGVDMSGADLRGAILTGANLEQANLDQANGAGAKLISANLQRANLFAADFSGADLHEANLCKAHLLATILHRADISRCDASGIEGGGAYLDKTSQADLFIQYHSIHVSMDGLEVAQFISSVYSQPQMWQFVDQLTTKIVLLLGNFGKERRRIINILKKEVQRRKFIPVTCNFEYPENRDVSDELLRIAQFVIADVTEVDRLAKDLPRVSLQHPSVPVQLLVQMLADDYGVMEELAASPSVLEPYRYQQVEDIQRDASALIDRAEQKVKELTGR